MVTRRRVVRTEVDSEAGEAGKGEISQGLDSQGEAREVSPSAMRSYQMALIPGNDAIWLIFHKDNSSERAKNGLQERL